MKKILRSLLFISALTILVAPVFGQITNRLKDKPAAASPAVDDKIYIDGTTNGVRALDPLYYRLTANKTIVGSAAPTTEGNDGDVYQRTNGQIYTKASGTWTLQFTVSVPGHTHVESDVTNLVSDLALKAPLASPVFSGTAEFPNATGLGIRDSDASHLLFLKPGSNITANRTLTLTTFDADRTITLAGNINIGGSFTTVGSFSTAFTATATTAVTLPTSGTLATLANAESLTNKKLGSLTTNGFVKTSAGDGTLSVDATNYVSRDLTYLGNSGNVSIDNVTNTAALWSSLPVGYARIFSSTIGTGGGLPENTAGHFFKMANREQLGGWGGLYQVYNTGRLYSGQTIDGTVMPTWRKIYSDYELGLLGSGLVKNTTSTGVLSIATAGTDYVSPAGTETLTNKTYNGGTINGLVTISAVNSAGLGIRNAGTGAFDMSIAHNGTLTAGRKLTWNLNDADRAISLSGNLTVPGTASVTGTNTGDQTITLTGDVTGTGTGSFATTVATLVGDSGSGGTKGLVPAPAAGDAAANKFLKANGTWTVPAGGGDVSSSAANVFTADQSITRTGANDATFSLSASAGQNRWLRFNTGASNRWFIIADGSVESGGNAGSNFIVGRYDDAGSYLGTALSINRATNRLFLNGAADFWAGNIGTTSTDGFVIHNEQPATVGQNQWSPRLRWIGTGWKTNATAASQFVEFIAEVKTATGTANPTGSWVLSSQVGSGGYTPRLSVSDSGGVLVTGAMGGLGYAAGSGGTITQATSRSTGVTLDKVSGDITLFTAAGSATATSFTVTNAAVSATDTISFSVRSATNDYLVFCTSIGSGSFRITFYTTGGTASDTPIIHFNVHKGVNS